MTHLTENDALRLEVARLQEQLQTQQLHFQLNGPQLIDMTGEKVGHLVVSRKATQQETADANSTLKTPKSGAWWVCRCENCGNDHYVINGAMLRSRAKRPGNIACGCLPRGKTANPSTIRSNLFESKTAFKLWDGARQRAKEKGLEFSIGPEDIRIPERCPLLPMIKLEPQKGRPGDNSPTLDRIQSHRGYVPGNVCVISFRANRIKSDATIGELLDLANNLRALNWG